VGGVQPRAGALLAGGENQLARQEQFACGDDRTAGGESLGQDTVVAAPGQVQAPYLAGAETEAGCAGCQDEGGVVAGASAAGLAQPGAVGEGPALRGSFAAPAAGEVEQFGGCVGDRQGEQQAVEGVVAVRVVVAYGGSHAHETGRGESGFQYQAEPGCGIRGPHLHGLCCGFQFQCVAGEQG
jgi:hypothetical protein